ncbi:MAG: ATP synthase F1 subunit epsilon [Bacteroidales bacterium]|jgi:F-type H+-transporting ATPase subunit epsilon|nr:ATP synthase F1 subunit epsilon [Bacteroidales bacterium]
MKLEIITPEKTIFSGKVDLIQVPGGKGSFEILEFHAPIISTLVKGKIKILERGSEKFFNTTGGIIEVKENKIIILSESINE